MGGIPAGCQIRKGNYPLSGNFSTLLRDVFFIACCSTVQDMKSTLPNGTHMAKINDGAFNDLDLAQILACLFLVLSDCILNKN